MIKINFANTLREIDWLSYQNRVEQIHMQIRNKTGPGSDFLGWVDWPVNYDEKELTRLLRDADYIRQNFEILVVIGIGGSYLGARAALEALQGLYPKTKTEILFVGQSFSPTYLAQVCEYLKGKKFAINVISKSGTTTETAIAFRVIRRLLIEQIGERASKKAIYVTTDKEKGALKKLADLEGYPRYVLPSDIGGRFSVLTAVGLFPLAVGGIAVEDMLRGAKQARIDTDNPSITSNLAYQYAITRDVFYQHNRPIELFVFYENQYTQLGEWLKQLYGESEGKEGKGLWPSAATFSTDLHSLGQFIQDGSPLLFETIIYVENPALDVKIPFEDDDFDGLNYLANRTLSDVNLQAFKGTLKAHVEEGKVPCLIISIPQMDAYHLGYLFYFFMKSCAMSAYLLGVNPFNQPGVEVYKRNMFRLLGKKGF
ncbi:MAG: glucose-6-phosphate isomerase [Bacilli bacterium]|jgi:glucose-6-phosphate isomerase